MRDLTNLKAIWNGAGIFCAGGSGLSGKLPVPEHADPTTGSLAVYPASHGRIDSAVPLIIPNSSLDNVSLCPLAIVPPR